MEKITMTKTTDSVNENPITLRLVWPQWRGASEEAVRTLFSEVPLDEARRGYAVGTAVLNAVLPAHIGPTAFVPESGAKTKQVLIINSCGSFRLIIRLISFC
jgi:arginase